MKISTLFAGAALIASLGAPAMAGVYSETNNTPGYFDESAGSRTVTFAEGGLITDLNITIHFSKCDGQFFNAPGGCQDGGTPYFNEMSFVLIGPDSTQVELFPASFFTSGGTGGEFTITFDSESGNGMAQGGSPASGTFNPTGSLTAFNGLTLAGLWTLAISDDTFADALSFYDYTINATTDDVPEPAMLGLFGLGAIGLGLSRRRKA